MSDLEYLKKYLPKDKLEEGIKRLENGEPVQYIVGNVDFYGYLLSINPSVLIPRFETELLVEKTINYSKKFFSCPKILDLGTGSGCIAIALKKELKSIVDAIDLSNKALEVAKKNAKENDADITFWQSDLFSNVQDTYDIIISNPPYLEEEEEIMDIVRNNEPKEALFAPNHGLEIYERIFKDAHKYIQKKALLAFEIGYRQGPILKNMAQKYFDHALVEKDYSGKDRFLFLFVGIKP